MRAPFQILLFPFIKKSDGLLYCIFKRDDLKVWQGIAGGGEESETPLISAKREAFEEAGISEDSAFFQLDSVSSIPVVHISGFIWGENKLVIPEFSFGVELSSDYITIGHEHLTYEWVTYEQAMERLNWDSNKTALWELNYRITHKLLKGN